MANNIMEDALKYNQIKGFVKGTIFGAVVLCATVQYYKYRRKKD